MGYTARWLWNRAELANSFLHTPTGNHVLLIDYYVTKHSTVNVWRCTRPSLSREKAWLLIYHGHAYSYTANRNYSTLPRKNVKITREKRRYKNGISVLGCPIFSYTVTYTRAIILENVVLLVMCQYERELTSPSIKSQSYRQKKHCRRCIRHIIACSLVGCYCRAAGLTHDCP